MNSRRTNTKRFHRTCWSVVILLVLWGSPSSSQNTNKRIPSIKYLNRLEERFADYKDESSPEEVLLILSDAETVCRLVATFDISEEGGNDFAIGLFIEMLIEKDRWDVLYKVLENHRYYPQTTGWVFEFLYEKNDNKKLEGLMDHYYSEIGNAYETMKRIIEILKERKAKKEDKTS